MPVYDDRYIKTKMRAYGYKLYTNLCGLNVPEDAVEWESFTIISIDSWLVYENKYCLKVYLQSVLQKGPPKWIYNISKNNLVLF